LNNDIKYTIILPQKDNVTSQITLN